MAAQTTAQARELMLGRWYGEKVLKDKTEQKWLVIRALDGTYLIQFQHTSPDGDVEQWSEVGIWGVRQPIYFTAMRGFVEENKIQPADVSNPDFYDAYRIISLSEDSFKYKSYKSGNVYELKRVGDDFEF